jgi:L-iditol 2-dehydrogenase
MHDVEIVKVEDVPEPALDPAGALIRVEACGVCGTDARTFFNGDPRAPSPWQLGHEPVGVLVEVGPDAELPAGVSKGDRVFLGSILTCGECRWCRDGFQNLCERHELYGYTPYPGAYAELGPGQAGRDVRRPRNQRNDCAPGNQRIDSGRMASRFLRGCRVSGAAQRDL